jgi:hypothetical protein
VTESEESHVKQVPVEVNPSVEVGFNICGIDLESDYLVNQGKPQMH